MPDVCRVRSRLSENWIVRAQKATLHREIKMVGVVKDYFTTLIALEPRTSIKIPCVGFSTFTPWRL